MIFREIFGNFSGIFKYLCIYSTISAERLKNLPNHGWEAVL